MRGAARLRVLVQDLCLSHGACNTIGVKDQEELSELAGVNVIETLKTKPTTLDA
jgi:hypothetical protein